MSSSSQPPAWSGKFLYEGRGGLHSLSPPTGLAVSRNLTVVNDDELVLRGGDHRGAGGGDPGWTRGCGAQSLHCLDPKAEVVSVVEGTGLVFDLPGLSQGEPEVDLFVGQVSTQLVTANLQVLLGAVEGLLEEEPGEGEREGADVISGEDDKLTLLPWEGGGRGLQQELRTGEQVEAGRGGGRGGGGQGRWGEGRHSRGHQGLAGRITPAYWRRGMGVLRLTSIRVAWPQYNWSHRGSILVGIIWSGDHRTSRSTIVI